MPIEHLVDWLDIVVQTLLSLEPQALGINRTDISCGQSTTRCSMIRRRRKKMMVVILLIIIGVSLISWYYFKLYSNSYDDPLSNRIGDTYRSNESSTTLELQIPSDGFAGCLLLKDDNHKLSEWIAYHWLVLPLKYLVVAVDPTGYTTPKEILDLWKHSGLGLEITLWNDVDYGHWINEELDDLHKHRDRQKRFLYECQRYHKQNNRSWVAIIDPDEYITYNLIQDDERHPEYINDLDILDIQDLYQNFTTMEYHKEMVTMRKGLVEHFDKTTIFDYMQMNESPWKSEPCYLMPRLFFSALESPAEMVQKAGVHSYGIDPTKFSTLRFFKHAEKGAHWANYFSKVMVDLSRIDDDELTMHMLNIHQPLKSACYYPVKLYDTGILRVQHYIGSWDEYSSKSDVRRSRSKFDETAWENDGIDYQLQGWLKRFLFTVGEERGRLLLQHSGVLEIEKKSRIIDGSDYVRVPVGEVGPYKYIIE